MAPAISLKVNAQNTVALLGNLTKLTGLIGEDIETAATQMASDARAILRAALRESPGQTGVLVSSISTRNYYTKQNLARWQVFIRGAAANYAAEIEEARGLPRNRRASGKILQWKERVESATGTRVPIREGNVIAVGQGVNPFSLYTRYPHGVQFMQQAFDRNVRSLFTRVDNTVNKNIR